ncbi:hypothetical protein LCGC14_0891830 [marine sediment metagenome]|uniref:Methyltransferase domain-containing protein n=1 Tax=marine sediment metagenome TaxID=412755 RepID=A0A0F9RIB5_9ZZZZ
MKDHFIKQTDLISLCNEWQFDYKKYQSRVLSIGDVCAIRKAKNGQRFRRNYERAMVVLAAASRYGSRRMLEFGTGRGFTAASLSMFDQVEEIVTIDKLKQITAIQAVASLNVEGVFPAKINYLSKNTFEISDNDITGKFDLVFIDGEHTSKAVAHDFQFAMEHTTDDAVIIFDDYRNKHKGVKKYIKSLKHAKILVYSDGWLYENILIASHGDADRVKDNKEYGSGQVILLKEH